MRFAKCKETLFASLKNLDHSCSLFTQRIEKQSFLARETDHRRHSQFFSHSVGSKTEYKYLLESHMTHKPNFLKFFIICIVKIESII